MAEADQGTGRRTRSTTSACRFFVVVMLLAVTGPAYGLTILPVSGRQVVDAWAEANHGVQMDSSQDSTESLTTDPFVEIVMASAATGGSAGSAFASQNSEVGDETVRGFGTSNASSVAPGAGANAESVGETLYLLEFEVDEPAHFQLDLQLTVASDQSLFTIASVSFSDDGVGTDFELQLPGSEQMSLVGDLVPGHVYQILALARSESRVPMPPALSSTGVASFDFNLTVPEASTGLLLALGLLVLSAARRR